MAEKMSLKERARWILAFLFHGPAGIGDVNLGKIPSPIMYLWFGVVIIWMHLPVVMLRKTLDKLRDEASGSDWFTKRWHEEMEETKRLKSVIAEVELELRRTGQLAILRKAQKDVEDPEWPFPSYRYNSEDDKEPRMTYSSYPIRF